MTAESLTYKIKKYLEAEEELKAAFEEAKGQCLNIVMPYGYDWTNEFARYLSIEFSINLIPQSGYTPQL